ncbi:hypothetical protein ACQKFJ_25505, partial [Bacillus mycoides]
IKNVTLSHRLLRKNNVFLYLGVVLFLKLMGMGSPYQKKKIVRLDTIPTHFERFAVRLGYFSLK